MSEAEGLQNFLGKYLKWKVKLWCGVMLLKLDIQCMELEMEITNYQSYGKGDRYELLCDNEISFKYGEYINYSTKQGLLFSFEIENLEEKLSDFLGVKMKKREILNFIVPDFEFEFCPSHSMDEEECGGSESEISEAAVKWKVKLWCGVMTDNYFLTSFGESEARVLRDYLRLVIGKIDKNSAEIQEYIKAGLIWDYRAYLAENKW